MASETLDRRWNPQLEPSQYLRSLMHFYIEKKIRQFDTAAFDHSLAIDSRHVEEARDVIRVAVARPDLLEACFGENAFAYTDWRVMRPVMIYSGANLLAHFALKRQERAILYGGDVITRTPFRKAFCSAKAAFRLAVSYGSDVPEAMQDKSGLSSVLEDARQKIAAIPVAMCGGSIESVAWDVLGLSLETGQFDRELSESNTLED